MRNTAKASEALGGLIGRRRVLRAVGRGMLLCAVAPLLTACPQGGEQSPVIRITERNVFVPTSLTITRGSIVAWQNGGTGPQTVTCDPAKAQKGTTVQLPTGAPPWDSGDLYAGEVWRHTFDTPGTYTYFSRYGEGTSRVGTITVHA